jgi:hypothetical protein
VLSSRQVLPKFRSLEDDSIDSGNCFHDNAALGSVALHSGVLGVNTDVRYFSEPINYGSFRQK